MAGGPSFLSYSVTHQTAGAYPFVESHRRRGCLHERGQGEIQCTRKEPKLEPGMMANQVTRLIWLPQWEAERRFAGFRGCESPGRAVTSNFCDRHLLR